MICSIVGGAGDDANTSQKRNPISNTKVPFNRKACDYRPKCHIVFIEIKKEQPKTTEKTAKIQTVQMYIAFRLLTSSFSIETDFNLSMSMLENIQN